MVICPFTSSFPSPCLSPSFLPIYAQIFEYILGVRDITRVWIFV